MSANNWTNCPRCPGPEDSLTWREDYEIGVDGGVFLIDYRGHCTACKHGIVFDAHRADDCAGGGRGV